MSGKMSTGISLTKGEKIALWVYFPLHLLLLPLALARLFPEFLINNEGDANFILYAVGAGYMLLFLGKYLRRNFDPFCDRPGHCILQVLGSYLAMLAFNAVLALVLLLVTEQGNPNNEAIAEMTQESSGTMTAAAVFLAPILEELMFRAGIFAVLRPKSRVLAYLVSMLVFSLCHVLPYAASPGNLIYVVQYLPVSFLLCRCFEKTDSIWTPIFLHMLVNAVSMGVIQQL